MTSLLPVPITGYDSKKFLVIISIVASSLVIDISLSNISDMISVSTSWGFASLYCYNSCICSRTVSHFRVREAEK